LTLCKNFFSKHKKLLVMFLTFMICMTSFQTLVYAHRAYFLQVLIDDSQMIYVGNVIKDETLNESNKIEAKLWEYKGGYSTGNADDYKKFEGSTDGKGSMFFTFPPKPYKNLGILNSRNNATSKDSGRAYEISDTLIPNLNELLLILNGGTQYEDVDSLIRASHKLVRLYENKGNITVGDYTISYNGSNTMQVTKDGETVNYIVKMKKGYKEPLLENGEKSSVYKDSFNFDEDYYTDEISIASIVTQANYTYLVKEHSVADIAEYSKPGTLEIKIVEFLTSGINSLKSLLNLREINELIFNKGIVGSSMYYEGLMPKTWMDNTVKFHLLFQALTWIAISIAIIKLLFQRNLATINPAVRVSLLQGIQDLLICGFMLIAMFLLTNTMLSLNKRIVAVFATTVPEYSVFNGEMDIPTLGGVLLQVFYFIITLLLNIIYIIRGITAALLIGSAPVFIASIAFQNRNKRLFKTWIQLFVSTIFMQSVHAFVFSFLLGIQNASVRGIELAVISYCMIPLTFFFNSLITGGNGPIDKLGIAGINTVGSVVGGIFGGITGGIAGVKSRYRGSQESGGEEIKTKSSDKIPGINENRERREHSESTPTKESTSETLSAFQTDLNENKEATNYDKLSGRPFKNTENLSHADFGKAVKRTAGGAKDVAFGTAKVAAGGVMTVASGITGKGKMGADLIKSGTGNIISGVKTAGITAGEFMRKGANELYTRTQENAERNDDKVYGNILGAETLDNGDVVVHRDKYSLERQGLKDIRKTGDENMAITYNKGNLSKEDGDNLSNIELAYKNGNYENLRQRGIEKVTTTESGDTVVHYNSYGQDNLGYKDAYISKNRVVETKSQGQPLASKLTYDINNVEPLPPSGGFRKSSHMDPPSRPGKSVNVEHKKREPLIGMDDRL